MKRRSAGVRVNQMNIDKRVQKNWSRIVKDRSWMGRPYAYAYVYKDNTAFGISNLFVV